MTYDTEQMTGRTLRPWYLKLFPVWWFMNSDEPLPPDWYQPTWPQWLRVPAWYIRNPLSNFADYVVGVCDRNYTVIGTSPLWATTYEDMPLPHPLGWKWSLIKTAIPLPFVSYTGMKVVFYAGWQPSGNLGFKFNILNSGVQLV